jgi:hypothetical protein
MRKLFVCPLRINGTCLPFFDISEFSYLVEMNYHNQLCVLGYCLAEQRKVFEPIAKPLQLLGIA